MNKNVLYSFRRCPYAIRARWVIFLCLIEIELREVDLKNKPKELLNLSPKGTVPVLITKERNVIDESLDIMIWSLENSKNQDNILKLYQDKESEINSLISRNDKDFKYHLDRYKYSSRYINEHSEFHKKEAIKILVEWNKKLINSNGWLVSNTESLADWSIWPFVRQFRLANYKEFDTNINLKSIREWLNYFQNHKLFNIIMAKYKPWVNNGNINRLLS